jgi:hypothetical protein
MARHRHRSPCYGHSTSESGDSEDSGSGDSSSSLQRAIASLSVSDFSSGYRVFWDADNVAYSYCAGAAIVNALRASSLLSMDVFASGPAAQSLTGASRAEARPAGPHAA